MDEGDRYTLGILVDLRALAKEAAESNSEFNDRFHQLLRSVSSSNTPDAAKEFPFRVRQHIGKTDEILRTVSLNGNMELARAAFEAAKKLYPNDRLVLLWAAFVVEDTAPPDA